VRTCIKLLFTCHELGIRIHTLAKNVIPILETVYPGEMFSPSTILANVVLGPSKETLSDWIQSLQEVPSPPNQSTPNLTVAPGSGSKSCHRMSGSQLKEEPLSNPNTMSAFSSKPSKLNRSPLQNFGALVNIFQVRSYPGPGSSPAVKSYHASAVKTCNATSSIVNF
jgi:hypothetical protein